MPVHELSFPHSWESRELNHHASLRCGMEAYVDVSMLREEGGFKAGVLKELEVAGKKKLSMTFILRMYVQGLGRVHESLRELLSDQIEQDDETLFAMLERAKNAIGNNLSGLALVEVDESNIPRNWQYINKNISDRRIQLAKKNSSLGSLASRYVSGAAEPAM